MKLSERAVGGTSEASSRDAHSGASGSWPEAGDSRAARDQPGVLADTPVSVTVTEPCRPNRHRVLREW